MILHPKENSRFEPFGEEMSLLFHRVIDWYKLIVSHRIHEVHSTSIPYTFDLLSEIK